MSTLGTILKDNWEWRGQIVSIALFDLRKQTRGSVLSWAWFIIKPVIYITCLWFAIEVGLKGNRTVPGDAPFILWLACGITPWFFMKDMLGGGIDVFRKYAYLVCKVKFPLSAISSIFTLSSLLVQLIQMLVLVAIYVACGQPLDIYLLQVPVIMLVMVVFWWLFSILMSPLCVMSRDVKNLMSALTTPFFWLSGVIFNVRAIPIEAIQVALYFNPITFFVTAFRDAIYTKEWVWEDPMLLIGFGVVFAITFIMAMIVYARTNEEVVDVL